MINKLKYMHSINFGDMLNPLLFEYITGTKYEHVKDTTSGECVLMIGSILNWAKSGNIVWGTGIVNGKGDISRDIDVRAVRGPLSRKYLLDKGVKCPEIYGDPAILLPDHFLPKVKKQYKLGIVPHVIDASHVSTNCSDILKIDLSKDPKDVIKNMLKCENIISSSLHGLIVADAYGIPSTWCEFSDKVIGNGFKFLDYYQSIGVNDPERLNFRKHKQFSNLDCLKYVEKYDMIIDKQQLMDVCPFTN